MKMTDKKRDPLKSLIQKVELDKPSVNFTRVVMEEVKAQKEAVVNPALKSLLKRNGIDDLAIDFTQNVMAKVGMRDFHASRQPIISKKVWFIIISAILFLGLYLGFAEQSSNSPDGPIGYFIDIGNAVTTLLARVNFVPRVYLITVISLSSLLVADYVLRKKSQEAKSQAST
jgi:hypothetical protein